LMCNPSAGNGLLKLLYHLESQESHIGEKRKRWKETVTVKGKNCHS